MKHTALLRHHIVAAAKRRKSGRDRQPPEADAAPVEPAPRPRPPVPAAAAARDIERIGRQVGVDRRSSKADDDYQASVAAALHEMAAP